MRTLRITYAASHPNDINKDFPRAHKNVFPLRTQKIIENLRIFLLSLAFVFSKIKQNSRRTHKQRSWFIFNFFFPLKKRENEGKERKSVKFVAKSKHEESFSLHRLIDDLNRSMFLMCKLLWIRVVGEHKKFRRNDRVYSVKNWLIGGCCLLWFIRVFI